MSGQGFSSVSVESAVMGLVKQKKKRSGRAALPAASAVRLAGASSGVTAPAAACSRDPLVRRGCRPGRPVLVVRTAAGWFDHAARSSALA